jgi:hypothetical protein
MEREELAQYLLNHGADPSLQSKVRIDLKMITHFRAANQQVMLQKDSVVISLTM